MFFKFVSGRLFACAPYAPQLANAKRSLAKHSQDAEALAKISSMREMQTSLQTAEEDAARAKELEAVATMQAPLLRAPCPHERTPFS